VTAKSENRAKVEIERKFLVDTSKWRPSVPGIEFRQGYLSSVRHRVVRVRIAGNKGWLTIKGLSVGITRNEFEYEIPVTDASVLLENLCERPIIAKTRYREQVGDRVWEVDVFHGDNEGLVVAEIELGSEDERFDKPEWATRDVSDDPRYFNNNLIAKPYKDWPV
jgi:adenylate cyclase